MSYNIENLFKGAKQNEIPKRTLKGFTIIPHEYLRDKKLSLKAKGLLSVMYSLPNDWDYSINGLCKITKSGITMIRSIITELEIYGYLERKQSKNEKGQFEYTYIVYIKSKGIKPKESIAIKRALTSQKTSQNRI